jgi:hypothetical protein
MSRKLVEMGNACCKPAMGKPFIPTRMGGIFSSVGMSVSENFFPNVLGKVQEIGVGTLFSIGGASSIGIGAFLGRRLGLGFMLVGVGATGYGLWTLYKALTHDISDEEKKEIDDRKTDATTILQARQSAVSGIVYLIDKYFPWFHKPTTVTDGDERLARSLLDEYNWRSSRGYVQHITYDQYLKLREILHLANPTLSWAN